MSEYIHKSHNVTVLMYHLVFPAKYRRAVSDDKVDEILKQICLEIEKRYQLKFLEIGTDKDHVHLLLAMSAFLHKLGLYVNSLRYSRWEQVVCRILYRFKKIKLQAPGLLSLYAWPASWKSPSYQTSSLLEPNMFLFLGETGFVESPADWNTEHKTKLWLYNLHYFDDLNAIDSNLRVAWHGQLIKQWIKENQPMSGNGWEPYPVSIRLVNWVKWMSRHDAAEAEFDKSGIIQSMGLQSEALIKQLEYHILGNHLFVNAKALVFVGAFFEGEPVARWLDKGLEILDCELAEQFLPDGGHFELSPMYHASLLWDICDLINLSQCSGIRQLEQRSNQWFKVLERGLLWLREMSHPDGRIAFFNDAAFNIAPDYCDLASYAQQLGCPKINKGADNNSRQPHYIWLQFSGYCRIEMGDDNVALLDLARIGPDYLPGHAHADTLSFELSLFGQRVLVNSGTSQYGVDNERHRQRSTAAHNTVVVNDQNSSEVWSGFRVAKRAYPTKPEFFYTDNYLNVSSSHNGYSRLAGRCIHQRQWSFGIDDFTVTDRIEGKFIQAEAYFHIHPAVRAIEVNPDVIELCLENGQTIRITFEGAKTVSLNHSSWHPEFGKTVKNSCITVVFFDNQLKTHISW